MSDSPEKLKMDGNTEASVPGETQKLSGGAYDVIKTRLQKQGELLLSKIDLINADRKEIFGGLETKVLGSGRIITKNHCIARDMVALGNKLIFGYDVFLGLRKDNNVEDVFSVYEFEGLEFRESDCHLLNSEDFKRDFLDLFTYYRHARFATFHLEESILLMVFHVGKETSDTKVFKWQVNNDQSLTYVNNRSEREYQYPPQVQFQWREATRDQHVYGDHPHISIEDLVFVECVQGDLTIKIENNTSTGSGIFSEPVDDKDQKLDDADVHYAIMQHLIFLKIKPYRETKERFFVYNVKTESAVRLDGIERCAVLLPDSDGVIFPTGYYLNSGEVKTFALRSQSMRFRKLIKSPNGEDFLYIFFEEEKGEYVLLQYNIIRKNVETPLECNGYALYGDGRAVLFKATDDAQKSHAIQTWQTPFLKEMAPTKVGVDSVLGKIGNKSLVTGIAELNAIYVLTQKTNVYLGLYEDLVKRVNKVLDLVFWLAEPKVYEPKNLLLEIRASASSAIDEFEKVAEMQRNARAQEQLVSSELKKSLADIKTLRFERIDQFVGTLHALRLQRGRIISLKDVRFIDKERMGVLEKEVAEAYDQIMSGCTEYLLKKDALKSYEDRLNKISESLPQCSRLRDLEDIQSVIVESDEHIQMLMELVNSLNVVDAADSANIIETVTSLVAGMNQVKAQYKKAYGAFRVLEVKGEFSAQYRLLGQAVTSYTDQAKTPEDCDGLLAKVGVQLEELEGRFGEFDDMLQQISEKREEIYTLFTTRKSQLQELRNKRVQTLFASAERILKSIESQIKRFSEPEEFNAYFAADMMVEKIRSLGSQLRELGDNGKSEDISAKLKSLEQDGARQLKDRNELFVDGSDVVRFGSHSFLVNTQSLELTTYKKQDDLYFQLNGTDFSEKVEDAAFLATRGFWDMSLGSESLHLSRAEFLAFVFIQEIETKGQPIAALDLKLITKPKAIKGDGFIKLTSIIREFMSPRYSEGYEKGVHDHDAAKIVASIYPLWTEAGLLRFHPVARAFVGMYLHFNEDNAKLAFLRETCWSYGRLRQIAADKSLSISLLDQLKTEIESILNDCSVKFDDLHLRQSARFLFEILCGDNFDTSVQCSDEAVHFFISFRNYIHEKDALEFFYGQLRKLQDKPKHLIAVARDWLHRFRQDHGSKFDPEIAEEALILVLQEFNKVKDLAEISSKKPLSLVVNVSELLSSHSRIEGGLLQLKLYDFIANGELQLEDVMPKFTAFVKQKHNLIAKKTAALRLDEMKPRVMSAFVRNQLINSVYLPLIGANLSKQMGTFGINKRTDLMGLLLLISPPGYGKTTLMEYVANRLGLVFMKINGPALGHQVTSVDPEEAPNATARKEVERLNLAFEMGNNVMIYIDDIQHCNTEFLQKFISLCDAQRKIEGVYRGTTKTYDFRGKRVAVVMAGNPYTESGEKFRIPDMLANRADTYNLGDILGGNAEAFELSYLENSLTSNVVLSKLASQTQSDVYSFVQMARGLTEAPELHGNYTSVESKDIINLFRKLLKVQQTVLSVNKMYIQSAGQEDRYRTEPSFLLQGSYRNMNKIAEKILPVMNDNEIDAILLDHYRFESQLLTSGAEFNLLRFKELVGWLSDIESERLSEIRSSFVKQNRLGGIGDHDPMTQIISQMDVFNEQFSGFVSASSRGFKKAS